MAKLFTSLAFSYVCLAMVQSLTHIDDFQRCVLCGGFVVVYYILVEMVKEIRLQ